MLADIPFFLIVVAILVVYLLMSVNILPEYERGVIFRLGKLLPQPKGPGSDSRLRAHRPHRPCEHADRRDGRAAAGRHHAG